MTLFSTITQQQLLQYFICGLSLTSGLHLEGYRLPNFRQTFWALVMQRCSLTPGNSTDVLPALVLRLHPFIKADILIGYCMFSQTHPWNNEAIVYNWKVFPDVRQERRAPGHPLNIKLNFALCAFNLCHRWIEAPNHTFSPTLLLPVGTQTHCRLTCYVGNVTCIISRLALRWMQDKAYPDPGTCSQ